MDGKSGRTGSGVTCSGVCRSPQRVRGTTAGGHAASGEGHSRAGLGHVPGSAQKWAEWKQFAGGVDNVCSRALPGEGEGWLQKGTQFLSGAHLPR